MEGGRIKKNLKRGRDTLNLLVQAGTGHALCGYHLAQWTEQDETCELCREDEESIEHLFFECPALAWTRMEMAALEDQKTMDKRLLEFFSLDVLKELFLQRAAELTGAERQRTIAPTHQEPNLSGMATGQ